VTATRRTGIAGALLAAALAITLAVVRGGDGRVERFLDRHVEPDGRVVRHDQGGDTVSEGQAYAMLLAVAAGDEERFARVWTWTRTHLRRPDGLLAWQWKDGHVSDPQPAADADLDAARALVAASERFDEPRYAAEGRALGRAVAAHETTVAAEKTVVVAGPWARDDAVVNPSYWSPRAFAALRLGDAAAGSRRLIHRLAESGLPPDWARVEPWGIVPTGPPHGGEPVYSYDALRVPIRLAESCDPADRETAARMWPILRTQPGASKRALDGSPLTRDEQPAALAGAAAAAHAAGEHDTAEDLLDRAAELDGERPSYYGGALVALTTVMLASNALGEC
jgi:endoglucanase